MNRTTLRVLVAPLLVLAPLASALAQDASDVPIRVRGEAAVESDRSPSVDPNRPPRFDGPPPPLPPAVISRDTAGRTTARAVRLASPLRVDGRLNEDVYTSVQSMSDFIQAEPQEGAPATERTEAWVTFDREYVYISFRCWESRPERMVANEMRRDSGNIFQGDFVGFTLDTFYDRRTAVLFTVNAIGGRTDGQVSDERQSTATGTRSGMLRSAGSTAGGRSKLPCRSSRCSIGRDARRSGASTCDGTASGGTRSRTSRLSRLRWQRMAYR